MIIAFSCQDIAFAPLVVFCKKNHSEFVLIFSQHSKALHRIQRGLFEGRNLLLIRFVFPLRIL